jgi:hypothetical protein
MPLVIKDRVKETTTTTGTGTLTLAGAATGFQGFSSIGNANTTFYAITDTGAGDWEVGIGTYTASGSTLSRDTVLSSSNAGSAVNFAAGTKEVFVTYPAEKAAFGGMGYVENASTVSQSSAVSAGSNALSVGPLTIDGGVSVTVPSGSRWVVL